MAGFRRVLDHKGAGTEMITGDADGAIRAWSRADARQVRGADLPGSGLIRTETGARAVRVFLCHSSADKPAVRDLYHRLRADGVQPWLDEEDILPGQEWQTEIRRAVRRADIVLLYLSRGSVTKAGYLQKEIKEVLDVAEEQPPGTIFAIPTKFEPCDAPEQLSRWQWVELFVEGGYERLSQAIRARAASAVHIPTE